MRRCVPAVIALVVLAACGKDEEPANVPVQQPALGAGNTAATKTAAPAPAGGTAGAPQTAGGAGGTGTKAGGAPGGAPGGATRGGGAPAGAASGAAADLAAAGQLRTVQVAALPDPATAQQWVTRLRSIGVPAYTTTATVEGSEVTRLRIGVAATGAEARALAEKIQSHLQWPTWITVLDDRSMATADMLNATRAYAAR